jgi:hypothetical protein
MAWHFWQSISHPVLSKARDPSGLKANRAKARNTAEKRKTKYLIIGDLSFLCIELL